MCRETLFSWPLLSLCCGLLVGFIPVQDDIIVQAWGEKILCKNTAWNPLIARLHSTLPLNSKRLRIKRGTFCSLQFGFFSPLPWLYFALPDMWTCDPLCCLFACLQKPNTAMPPCHPSSAAGRGKAWKGKAKARKTRVAGKDTRLLVAKTCIMSFFSSSATRHS